MKRPLLIAALGLLVVLVAIALNFFPWLTDEDTPPELTSAPPTASEQPPSEAQRRAPVPTFDVARVNPHGDAVIAGRALPGSTVRILDGSDVLGEVEADARGEWVFLPQQPLPPGQRRLSLEMDAGGTDAPLPSEDVIVLIVPEPGQDIAGRPADAPTEALVLRVPRTGDGPTTVLQKPPGPMPDTALAGKADSASGEAGSGSVTDQPTVVGGSMAPPPDDRGTAIDLAVDVIDYDDAGRLTISGRAPAGVGVHVYLDNTYLGATRATDEGTWQLSPDRAVDTGLYALRADQVTDGGEVQARVELPFMRAKPLAGADDDTLVVVQPGNSLWRIARRTYGSGFAYSVIYDANQDQIRDPDLIYPGQVFALPTIN